MKNDIENIRKEIDLIDDKIIELFKQRIELSSQILKTKQKYGLNKTDERREIFLFNKIKSQTKDISKTIITEIYRTYLSCIKK